MRGSRVRSGALGSPRSARVGFGAEPRLRKPEPGCGAEPHVGCYGAHVRAREGAARGEGVPASD